jgi:hypothetical protein
MARDEAGWLYLSVAFADETNPNIRFVKTYPAAPGSLVFDVEHPVGETWVPTLKIDLPALLVDGKDLIPSATTHAPVEAPRDSDIQATRYVGVAHLKPPPERSGPCGPEGLPYFRPGNNLTRGQVCKIVVEALEALGHTLPEIDPTKQYFEDIPATGPGSTYHEPTAKLTLLGAIGGYVCTPQP